MQEKGKNAKVTVIGLAGQSAFFKTEHFPLPGETIACASLFFEPGGKGYNQAIACARMGGDTTFIGAVGEDENADVCRKGLEKEGIRTYLIPKQIPTAYAVITTDLDGENTVQVFPGAANELEAADLYTEEVQQIIKDSDYLLLQNELSLDCLKAAIEIAKMHHVPIILNPAPAENLPVEILEDCEVITPNYGEAKMLFGYQQTEDPSEEALLERVLKTGVKCAVITMGARGALLLDENGYRRIPAFFFDKAVDTTGAGDTFNGVLCAALAAGKGLDEAAELAAIAAGISVTRPGAAGSIPEQAEVRIGKKLRELR